MFGLPPTQEAIVKNEGLKVGIPYKQWNNPGGDWNPGWGVVPTDMFVMSFGFFVSLKTKDVGNESCFQLSNHQFSGALRQFQGLVSGRVV